MTSSPRSFSLLLSPQGYVSLVKLVSFNKLRQMTAGDVDELVAAAVQSPVLKFKAQAIRLRKGWMKWIPPPPEGEERREDQEDSSEDDLNDFSDHLTAHSDDVNGSAEGEAKTVLDPSVLNPQTGQPMVMGGQGGYYHGMPPQPMYYNFPPAYGYPYYPHPYYAASSQINPVLMQQQQQHFAAHQQQQHQQHAQAQAAAQVAAQQHALMFDPHQQGGQGGGGMEGPGRRNQPRGGYQHRGRGRGGHHQGLKRGGQSGGQFSGAPSPQSGRGEGGGGGPGGPTTSPHDN